MLPIGIIACVFNSASLISSVLLLYWLTKSPTNRKQIPMYSLLLTYNFLGQGYIIFSLILNDPGRPIFYGLSIFLITFVFNFFDANLIIEMVKIYSIIDPELFNTNKIQKFQIINFCFLIGVAILCIIGMIQTYNDRLDRNLSYGLFASIVWNL